MTPSTEIDHSDHHPATVSSESVERQERGDLFSSGTLEEELLTEPTKKIQNQNKNENHEQERENPVSFRHTGMAARIQRESC